MKSTPCSVPVMPAQYSAYKAASRKLRKEMGASAPTAIELMSLEFRDRKADGIVEAYLDSILWHHPGNVAKRQRRARR